MTRGRKILIGVLVTLGVLGVVAVVGYLLYVVAIFALLHTAFSASCPPSDEKLTNACTQLSNRDPAVHCDSSREGPIPSGPQGYCETFNRVRLDWKPSADAGWQVQPYEHGSINETKDIHWDAGAWSCQSGDLTFVITPDVERSADEIARIRAAFDAACTSFKSR